MHAKLKIRNESLGEIEVDPESVLHAPEGLVGFEDETRFYLIRRDEYLPFLWLVSARDPDVAFAIVDPEPFLAEPYGVILNEADRGDLDLREGDPVQVFVIVSPADPPEKVTLNLKGPLLLNPRNRVIRQLLFYSSRLPLRMPIGPAAGRTQIQARRHTTVSIVGRKAA
jgi:flagellar assembly factor FliW